VTIDGKPQLISPAAEATIAYDPANGNELWRITTGGMNQAAKPIVGHGLIYLTTGHSQGMIAMKEGSGGQIPSSQIAWKMIKNVPTRPSFLLQEDYIYMVSDNGFASCVNAKTGSQVWVERFNASFSASPIIAHNTIYIPDQEGTTQVFAATPEFKSLAKNKLDSGCMASPAVAGEAIFLRTKTHLYCIEKKS
jgi:outer membrane protein assembly factor BamB